jgi:hypothetical protein
MFHVLTGARSRTALLALVLTGVLAGTAAAAAGLTIDGTAPLSPGRLHATLSGSITCNSGSSTYLSGQISQTKGGSGFGSTQITCTGSPQAYTIDVGASGFPFGGSGAPFKAGKASAQVSYSTCTDPFFPICTTQYTDAIIRLKK